MRILLAIDDTDNAHSRGTGELASMIADAIPLNGWGTTGFVTRHQLLVHPDIPYTSHNSAMCFPAEIAEGSYGALVEFACIFLERECADGSDPGLCVAVPDRIAATADLVAFGRRAKQAVLDKVQAASLAQKLGIHLSEHGGTGHGIIGALAAVGLRLWGNDGRMRGKLATVHPGQSLPVRELLVQPDVDAVRTVDGRAPAEDEPVLIGDKPKTVMLDGLSVLLVSSVPDANGDPRWQTLPRKHLRDY